MGNGPIPERILKELAEGEVNLWWAKPKRFPFIPLPTMQCLFFLAFIPFWFSNIHWAGLQNSDSLIWFQLSILLGLGLLSICFIIAPSRQLYAVTKKRVIIKRNFLPSRVSSNKGLGLSKMQIIDRKGIGSICFDEKPAAFMFDPSMQMFPTTLFEIERPADVAKLIQNTFNLKVTP